LADRVTRDGHVLAARTIVKNKVTEGSGAGKKWIADPRIDVVITTGGTGLTGAMSRRKRCALVRQDHRRLRDGLAHDQLSIGRLSTMQSRACAGLTKGTLIFRLAGLQRRLARTAGTG
jgi:molybdenum cofactor biosynthesis protein B